MFLQLLLALLFGTLCADQAKKRGRHPIIWFCLGAVFSILAAIALFLLPSELEGVELKEGGGSKENRQSPAAALGSLPPVSYVGDPRCYQWFFLDQTRTQKGPVAFRNLHTAWDNKELSLESYVWTHGMNEWKPIRAVPSLLERLQLLS